MTGPKSGRGKAAVVFVLPYMEAGGTERHGLHLMDGLRERFRFGLLAPAGPLLPEFVGRGAVHREFPRLESSMFQGIAAFRNGLRSLVGALRPSLIHVHAAPELALLARSAARREGIPVVLTLHGFAVNNPESNFKIANTVARLARVARVITVSEAERRLLEAAGYPKDRIRVVYNGIPDRFAGGQSGPRAERGPGVTMAPGCETARAAETVRGNETASGQEGAWDMGEDPSPVDWRKRSGWPAEAPVIGTVGRLERVKGFDVLLDAFARLTPPKGGVTEMPRLVIVGDGSQKTALRRQAEALGISERLSFAGYMTDAARAPVGFDVMAIPSRQEALPLACLEAMAAGTPVVASNVGGLPEAVLDGETGLIVPPDNVEALAAALQSLLDNPEPARIMGRRGRQRFLDKFRVEVMVEHTWNVYQEVIR